jgi:hypothetical protein
LPCLRLPDRWIPADSWWPGQTPAQEARLAGVRNRVMSAGLGDDDLGGGLLDPGDGHQVFNLGG